MRISVQGTSGAGKTTLARRLAARLGVPHIELDAINWQPGWRGLNEDDPAELVRRVDKAVAADSWVCDGNYAAVVRLLVLARATDVVLLDYGRAVVMRRVVWRSFSRWLLRREVWPGTGNRERLRMRFEPDHPSATPGPRRPAAAPASPRWSQTRRLPASASTASPGRPRRGRWSAGLGR